MANLTGTKPHQRLVEILKSEGYDVVEEYPVGSFFVDVVDLDNWVGYEADGPSHSLSRNRDQIRDANIFLVMKLPILRLSYKELLPKKKEQEVRKEINSFVDAWADNAEERRNNANTGGT